jgi:dTDP-4-dehydrorhamnose reductase
MQKQFSTCLMPSQKKILVTGSNGQLGSELSVLSSHHPQYSFVFFDRISWPVQDDNISRKIFEEHYPDLLINAAAYTAVDKAEEETELANTINGHAVGNLAALCKEFSCKFIHISTDYVFDGNATSPLKESDKVDPLNAYGASKLLGEELALKNNPDSIVIRTSWVYSSFGKNFVKTMLRLMSERESINVVADQIGSPTYAADLAEAIMQVAAYENWQPGIYNYSNEGVISWADFAKEIASQAGLNCAVNAITTEQYPTPAKRPRYSVLDKTKIQQAYNIQLKDWKSSLQNCLNKIKETATA